MRRLRPTGLALATAAGLALVAAPPAAASIDEPFDIRVTIGHLDDDLPSVLLAEDVVPGDGPELTNDDATEDSRWGCADLKVDVDPATRTVHVERDEFQCSAQSFVVELLSPEIRGVVVLEDEFGTTNTHETSPHAHLTASVDSTGARLAWVTDESGRSFYNGGSATLGYTTDAPFPDVPAGDPFAWYVWRLAESGVTGGYADGGFHPAAPVSRQAMAAFLYRIAGAPEFVPPAVSPFADVATGDGFYLPIAWLADMGISTGTVTPSGTFFRPTEPVSRQAMAAFLHRLAGAPPVTAPSTSPFADVAPGAPFYAEISWLASTGISTGTELPTGTVFRPASPVSRQAMAAFLHRFDELD